jgi:hypothetical protein
MELSPFCEAASRSTTVEFSKILWNRKCYYCVHKSPSLVLIVGQINPVHKSQCIYLRIVLVLLSQLCLRFASGFFPSVYLQLRSLAYQERDECGVYIMMNEICM